MSKQTCVCNIGVQECSMHPGRLRTPEQKRVFSQEWDRVAEAYFARMGLSKEGNPKQPT
jgi:hypothetical protein